MAKEARVIKMARIAKLARMAKMAKIAIMAKIGKIVTIATFAKMAKKDQNGQKCQNCIIFCRMLINWWYFLKLCFHYVREVVFARIQKNFKDVKVRKFDDETQYFDKKPYFCKEMASLPKCDAKARNMPKVSNRHLYYTIKALSPKAEFLHAFVETPNDVGLKKKLNFSPNRFSEKWGHFALMVYKVASGL